jgi:hypothetical protein
VPEPDRIGRYRVVRLLGSGAFATVWLAHDDALDAPVAVKVLAENWAHRLDVHERFLQEAQILRRCDSDRVVQVYDLGELDDGRPYFVMAYADRGTLADRLAAGPLEVPTALRYAMDAALGVAALHDIGVIHRDVKPSNVLLRTGRGGAERVLVADLGMAKAAARASGITQVAGTPGYMAPEQVTGQGLGVRADVYGLGVVAHELLTGRLPGGTDDDRPGVPEELQPVLDRALAADPDQRYADAGELASALAHVTTLQPVRVAAPAASAAPPRADRSSAGTAQRPPGAQRSSPPSSDLRTAPTAPAGAPPPRRRRRRVVAALLGAITAAAAAGVLVAARQSRFVTVQDSTRGLTVTVPSAWAGQLQDSGWSLERYGRPAQRAAALAVAPDLARWRDARSTGPGLFVGVAPGVPASEVLAAAIHPACAGAATRAVTSGTLTGEARRHTGCAGSTVAWDEVALSPPGGAYTVYLQVKAPDADQLDHTADILASLTVAETAAP